MNSTHPTPDELLGFGQGRLTADRQQEIEQHVETCDLCCERLRAVPDDTLVGRLRLSETLAQGTRDTRSRLEASTVPAVLIHHPRYRILKRLGAGGMGVVYKAEHRLMERAVALKVINLRLIKHRTALERFRLEVKAAARLAHPNIVTAYDADEAGELQILVMEFVDGISLARQVEKAGPLPIRFACQFARQAALGLQHAHEKVMVHRDIKPQNLMLTRDGRVKILDFGLARFIREVDQPSRDPATPFDAGPRDQHAETGLTQEGMTLGTPDYIAPEQIRNARTADIRADIYSLGCTLYFMLTGQVPFPQSTTAEKLAAHLHQQPSRLTHLRPEIPAGLVAVVERMMAKEPTDRYATPAEVAAALLPFLQFEVARPAQPVPQPRAIASTVDDFFKLEETAAPIEMARPLHQASPSAEPLERVLTFAKRHRRMLNRAVVLLLMMFVGLPLLSSGLASSSLAKLNQLLQAVLASSDSSEASLPLPTTDQVVSNGPRANDTWDLNERSRAAAAPRMTNGPFNSSAATTDRMNRVRILLVVPHRQYWYPDVANLRRAAAEMGFVLNTASSRTTPAEPSFRGDYREKLAVDLLLGEARSEDYVAVIFTGSNPCDDLKHLHDPDYAAAVSDLVRQRNEQGRLTASIGSGTRVLADLGFLRNRMATRFPKQVFHANDDKTVRWVDQPLVVDGTFITARDENSAKLLMQSILQHVQ